MREAAVLMASWAALASTASAETTSLTSVTYLNWADRPFHARRTNYERDLALLDRSFLYCARAARIRSPCVRAFLRDTLPEESR